VGIGENINKVYLIDFGLSTFYVDENGEPIEDYSDSSVGTMYPAIF
jgi:hypothetical protein